jgi:tol-pal system protein YbgF
MRTSFKFFVLFGVALIVTPIFSSVSAQQNGAGADLFLEMQGMRSEIAELRDMVERQQHQMKKLQRSLGQQDGQGEPASGQQAYNNQAQAQQGYQAVPAATPYGSAPQYTDNPEIGSAPANYSDQAAFPASSTINSAEAFPSLANQDELYRPNRSASVNQSGGASASSEYPFTSDIPVEERLIGATKLSAPVSNYPPVIERSIGGAENDSGPEAQASVLDAGFVGNDQVANNQYPIDASATPQSPRSIEDSVRLNRGFGVSNVPQAAAGLGGSGVIAIPTSGVNSTVSNSEYAPVASSQSRPSVSSDQQTEGVQPEVANAQATGMSEQDYYQRGFDLLKESKHSQAVKIFKQQISTYPQGSYADDAHYWIAESMYVNRALDDSKQYFRAIIDNYSQSPRQPDAMLKTAYIEQEQGNVIEARILLQEIIQYHPRSNAAISAKNRLPELK